MRIVKNLKNVKQGDYYLFKPISHADKRKTIVIIKNKTMNVFGFNYQGIMKKIIWKNNNITEIAEFYPQIWSCYKLNKKEITQIKKELILESL